MTKEEMELLRCGDFVTDELNQRWTVVANYGNDLKVISASMIINDDLREHYKAVPSMYQEQLEADSKMLNALEAAGVDNWEGYSEALRRVNGED